jgi:hypothetical protein
MVSKKSKLIFLMPPKTASNSLKECLLESSIKLEDFPKDFKYPNIHLYLSELVKVFKIEDLKEYKIIQVCRNPYERFASLYYHNLRMLPENHKLKKISIEDFAKRLYKSLLKGNFLDTFYGDKNFILKSIGTGKTWGGARTFLQQIQWCDLPANIKYFKIEDITNSMDSVSDYIGTYLPDMEKRNENKTEVDYNSVLTKEIKEIVQEISFDDFKELEYEY